MLLFSSMHKFQQIPVREKRIFFSCLALSVWFSFVIRFSPLKYYYGIFKKTDYKKLAESEMDKSIGLLVRAMKRVKKTAFWDCSCLNQVLTLKYLSARTGIPASVKFKLMAINSKDMKAHATLLFNGRHEYLALSENTKKFVDLCVN
jgi:hypothetical protein